VAGESNNRLVLKGPFTDADIVAKVYKNYNRTKLPRGTRLNNLGRVPRPWATWQGPHTTIREVTQMATKEFLSVRETAQQLGVHENTVRNWETRGVLHALKLPGSGFRRFRREDIARMRREMLESYAPATELPEEPHKAVKGSVVDGDVL
jgi:excisionase family DNA binding protein